MTKTKQTNKQKTHPDPAAKAEHTLQLKKDVDVAGPFISSQRHLQGRYRTEKWVAEVEERRLY